MVNMKILLIIIFAFSLSSCDKASEFMYENFSLQKNIDKADENSRKNIEGDFKIDGFGYSFPPNVGRFTQNGFDIKSSIEGQSSTENIEILPANQTANIYLTKDGGTIFAKATNNTSKGIDIQETPISYIEISKSDIGNLDFSLGDIKLSDPLYEMEKKVPDKEIIALGENSKDKQNDQYYMYLNGKYVAIFTLYQGKLEDVEIIPNDKFFEYNNE